MHSEQRKERRTSVNPQLKGKLQVLQGDHCHSVLAVKDTSSSGFQLEIGAQVDIGENILVRYHDEKIDMKLNGIVVWNSMASGGAGKVAKPNAYLIGIKLASPSMLQVFEAANS